jgi:GNAT superfamily N-acetyltransferase
MEQLQSRGRGFGARAAAEIDPLAVAVWPARETLARDGWLMRFTDGLTHRGNSVATFAYHGPDVTTAIEHVEQEYSIRNLVPMFQVATWVQPDDLAGILTARGYEAIAPTFVRVAAPADMIGRLPSPGEVSVETGASDAFAALVVNGSRTEADGLERIGILSRIAVPHICVTALSDGVIVSCGTAAIVEGNVGINLMRTAVAHRRHGHALRVLSVIAQWAERQDARQVHLGVEMANAPAIALYERAGFVPAYSYRYFAKSGRG